MNVHHFAEQIKDFFKEKNNFGIKIEISDESGQLLDTGGGLKKAAWFFDDNEPFLVHNVDVISDIDIDLLYHSHIQSSALATLAVRKRESSRFLLFDERSNLCGWKNIKTGELKNSKGNVEDLIPFAFSGIQIIEPEIFSLMNESGKFSMIDVYLRLATYHKISGFSHDPDYWFDLGKPENIPEAEAVLKRNQLADE